MPMVMEKPYHWGEDCLGEDRSHKMDHKMGNW